MPNNAIPTPDGSFFGLKFHQVAIYIQKDGADEAIGYWQDAGFDNWHHDQATLVGSEHGLSRQKQAHMWFNYDILPLELEYVSYEAEYRHANDNRDGHPPFLSHMSTYVDDIADQCIRLYEEWGLLPYHRFVTKDHINPVVLERGIRFMEAIYDTTFFLGFDIKLIKRVSGDLPWEDVQKWSEWDIRDAAKPTPFHNEIPQTVPQLSESYMDAIAREPRPHA